MVNVAVAAVLGVVAMIFLVLALLFAQGAPSAVQTATGVTINPTQAQTIPITMTFTMESLNQPNPIWSPGIHVQYDINETGPVGGVVFLAVSQQVAPAIMGQSGDVITLQATESVTTLATCQATSCGSSVENLTVTARAQVVTPFETWFGPWTKTTFSSNPSYSTPPQSGTTSTTSTMTNSFLAEATIPLTLSAALFVLATATIAPICRIPLFIGSVILFFAIFVEAFIFGVL